MKMCTLDESTDKYIGEKDSTEREQFSLELKLKIVIEMIKKARRERYLTEGQLVEVQKAQISIIENNAKH